MTAPHLPASANGSARPAVLVICKSFHSSMHGGARNVRERVRALGELGYSVCVVSSGGKELFDGEVTELVLPEYFDFGYTRFVKPARAMKIRCAVQVVDRWIDTARPCAVMVHGAPAAQRFLRMQSRVPLYFFRHDSSLVAYGQPEVGSAGEINVSISRGGLAGVLNDLTSSSLAGQPLLRRLGLMVHRRVNHRRIGQIQNFVANSRYIASVHGRPDAIVQYPPLSDDHPHVLPVERDLKHVVFLGRFEQNKGVLDAVRIVAQLPQDYRLTLIGDGPQRDDVLSLVHQLGLKRRVRLTGWLTGSACRQIQAAAGVTLVPSHWDEPFGAVGIESLNVGVPVVAYRVGGIPEWCELPAGILVDRGDIAAAAKAVLQLCSSPAQAAEASDHARELVRKRFSRDAFMADMRQLMEHATGKAPYTRPVADGGPDASQSLSEVSV